MRVLNSLPETMVKVNGGMEEWRTEEMEASERTELKRRVVFFYFRRDGEGKTSHPTDSGFHYALELIYM